MYSEEYTIKKLLTYFDKSTLSLIKYANINYLCKYLDSYIYLIDKDYFGVELSHNYFEKSLIKHNQEMIEIFNIYRISENYDKISIKKILYLMETYNFNGINRFLKKDWIKNTHYSNYPKIWIAMIFVYDVIHKYNKLDINEIIMIKNKYIYCKNRIALERCDNLRRYHLKLYNNLWKYNLDIQESIDEVLLILRDGTKINIINSFNILENECQYIRDYIDIYLYIIDNILWSKGYYIDTFNQNRDKKISNIFFNIIIVLMTIYFTFLLYIYFRI